MSTKPKKQRWYLGGPAGAGAVLVTHPLDLLKVCFPDISDRLWERNEVISL